MQKTLYGAIMGLLVGGPAALASWAYLNTITNNLNNQNWVMVGWIAGWTVWGAVLGTVLPKHK